MNETHERPGRSLPSWTEKIRTERGNLFLVVTFDEYDRPFEVFGWIGKTGTFGHSSEPDPLDFVESDLVA